MAYKVRLGHATMSGSLGTDDIVYSEDPDTGIDFEPDTIKFETGGTERLVVTNNGVGIGTASPTEVLTLNATDPTIRFEEGGTFKATIGVNSADNILIENKSMNKHIVFKANDQGTVREGLRLDGAVPEVVVNQQHGINGDNSLIDFRVESESSTHMFFVDGSADKIGVNTSSPHSGLQIDSSVAFSARGITQNHTARADDHTIFANATSTNITVTLPTAANIMGRQYVIKRVDSAGTSVTIATDGSETIEGASSMILDSGRSVVIQSDNSNWWIVAEYISPP